jgi:hypothetical protein
MTILDEREPGVSLKLVVVVVTVLTALAFGGLFAFNSSAVAKHAPMTETTESGNI